MARTVGAELVETPDADDPYKVVVTREGKLIAEVDVSSKAAGEAMIKRIREGGEHAVLRLT